MSAIDNCALIPFVKTSRPIDADKSARNCFVVDVERGQTNRGNRESGVLFLVIAAQTNWRSVVMLSYKLQWRFALGGACANDLFGVRSLRGTDNRNSGLDDSRFFAGDFG